MEKHDLISQQSTNENRTLMVFAHNNICKLKFEYSWS